MRRAAALLLTAIGFAGFATGTPAPAMPDPSQTFNLWSYFIANGAIDGAIALTYSREQDAARLRNEYEAFATRTKVGRPDPVALGHEIHGELALVLVFQGRTRSGRLDIDPIFLIRDGVAWKLLPAFGTPRRPLNVLSDEQNEALLALAKDYRERRADLKKKYAEMIEAGDGGGPDGD